MQDSWTGHGRVLGRSSAVRRSLLISRCFGKKEAITMAEVILNPMIKEIRGELDGVVYRVSPNGKTYISKSPDMSKVKWSKVQKAHRQRMAKANDYAHAAMANPAVRAIYEKRAAKEKRVAYRVALSDYM